MKGRLADLLTARTEETRQLIVLNYRQKYGQSLEKDVKSIFEHGTVMHIMHLLLNTRAQYDAEVIKGYIENSKLKTIANIICCRTTAELRVYTIFPFRT